MYTHRCVLTLNGKVNPIGRRKQRTRTRREAIEKSETQLEANMSKRQKIHQKIIARNCRGKKKSEQNKRRQLKNEK